MKKLILQSVCLLFIANVAIAQQWQVVTTPFSAFPGTRQSLYAKNDVVLVSDKFEGYSSVDAGKTWTLMNLPNAFQRPVALATTQKKLVAATYNQIFVSTDKGKTWSIDYATGVEEFVTQNNVVYGATSKGVVQYNETSATWEIVGLSGQDIRYINTDGKSLYAGIFLKNNYTTQRSGDNGKTWALITGAGVPFYVAKVGNTVYEGSFGSGISTSKDNGTTFGPDNLQSPPSSSSNDMVVIDDSLFVSFRGGPFDPSLGLYRYDAAKDTWTAKNAGLTNKNLVKLAYNGNGTLWAMQKDESASAGALYKIGIGKKTSSVIDHNRIAAESKLSVFPNPSTGFINLRMNQDEVPPIQIELYDLQGRLIESIKNNTGTSILFQKPIQGAYLLKCYFGEQYTVHNIVME